MDLTGILVFFGIVFGVVMVFRYLRRREMEAFREADLSVFQDFDAARRDREEAESTAGLPPAVVARAAAANVVDMRQTRNPVPIPVEPVYALREALFDEFHRSFLQTLEEVVQRQYRVFVHVPLDDIVRAREAVARSRISALSVSFLVCDSRYLTPVCGFHLTSASPSDRPRLRTLRQVFEQINRPLFEFPLLNQYAAAEIGEAIDSLNRESALRRHCPKCGKEMTMRKAVKGRNAGKSFWVCREFPSCKGILRIGRF